MFCPNCSKLAILHTKKTCIRCQGEVFNNLSVLCETCSGTEKICSICLKKTQNSLAAKLATAGCGPCRAKQR